MTTTLYSAAAISLRITELGKCIAEQTPEGPIVLVGVLKGSFIFMADLVRAIPRDVLCDFVSVASYGSATQSSGSPRLTKDLSMDIRGRHVLLVEDIVDSGLTARFLLDLFAERCPGSLRICALLDKPSRRRVSVEPDFVGFRIEDVFVVGYGLDFAERHRNLPFLGILEGDPA